MTGRGRNYEYRAVQTDAEGLYEELYELRGGLSFLYFTHVLAVPGIAKNTSAIDQLVNSMPEGVGRAFGLSGFGTAELFISGEYYGLILILLLAIVCVQLSTQLMAKLVDQGDCVPGVGAVE